MKNKNLITMCMFIIGLFAYSQTPQVITKELQLNTVNLGSNTDDVLVRNSVTKRVKKIPFSSFVAPQVKSDWFATTGAAEILNKPRILTESELTNQNTAVGIGTLQNNGFGYQNVAIGNNSLFNNTQGFNNTAIGYNSLYSNFGGYNNIAIGYNSLYSNYNGGYNISIGNESMYSNDSGYDNIAIGQQSLKSNNYGNQNIAFGNYALFLNEGGSKNIAIGERALYAIKTGYNNIVFGENAGQEITSGNANTIIGVINGTGNVSNSIFIGTGNGVSRLEVNQNGVVKFVTPPPTYLTNSAALSGGLKAGDIYQLPDFTLKIVNN